MTLGKTGVPTRRIRVLAVEESAGVGGSTISLCGLLQHLDPRLFELVAIFSRPEQEQYCKNNVRSDIQTTVISRGPPPKTWKLSQLFKQFATFIHPIASRAADKVIALLDILLWEVPFAIRLSSHGRKKQVDVYLDNDCIMATPVIASMILRIPLVVIQRGPPWQSRLGRLLARQVAVAVGNSETTRRELAALEIPEDRLRVIYPPLDTQRFNTRVQATQQLRHEFRIDANVPCFGIVGNLDQWKGHDVFLDAARRVLDAIPEAMALVVGAPLEGRGAFEQELRDRAKQLNIGDSVIFTGFRSDIPQLMAMMNVVVHASTQPEPFGRVIIEAMAVGRPVVATRPGGPGEIIRDGETGCLVPPNDPLEMAARIVELLQDGKRATQMGQRAAADVNSRFSAESQAARLGEILLAASRYSNSQ